MINKIGKLNSLFGGIHIKNFSKNNNSTDFKINSHLSESQLNIFLHENIKDVGTGYNNPFKIEFKNNYSSNEINNALLKLFDIYPILKARIIINNDDFPVCSFDAEPEISEGSLNDVKSFVRPFELEKSLSRFLIVDNISACLCMDIHHLIFDINSLNILLNSLNSILNNEDIDFVDDGILRQVSFEENITSEYMDDSKKFFDSMLVDKDEVYELLPSINNENNDFLYHDTLNIDNKHLTSFLQSHSLTHNQFFASVFAYTLSRFTGSSKVLFNLIDDGRKNVDLSESVGMFVKILPILMDCTDNDVGSFFEYASDLINSVMKCDMYPFRILAHEYDLNSNVLFNYSHNINNTQIDSNIEELKHDLQNDSSFNIFNSENNLEIKISYSNKYSKELIERFVKTYKLILNEMMDVGLLSDIDYSIQSDMNLLDSYNCTESNIEFNDVLDAFNYNLSRNPNNKLVAYNDKYYTYGEGAYFADRIAKELSDLGIVASDCVGFLVPRSELYMFCVLGILSAGAVYVPLDDNHPDERLRFMLDDTSSKVVIVSDETYDRAKNLTEDVVLLNISDIVRQGIETKYSLPVIYSDLASVLYTSGSTGRPKGVKITRDAILNSVESYADKFNITDEDVYGLFATIGFNTASLAICQSFYSGACLSVVPDEIKLDMVKLNDYFTQQGATHTLITTPVGKLYLETIEESPLKVILLAGEKLGEFDNPNNYQFVNAYGLTEVFSFITSICNTEKIDSSSIGKWNLNTKIFILDDELRRVPVGAVGELCISGYQISDGYLNREEENSNAFVKNPFDDSKDYNVLFHTGDMVRILPDGTLGIIGRRDSQVKIRGNRVELSEVESVIRQLDYVTDVSVQTVKNESNNELVAYVVVDNDCDEEKLRENVLEHVGEYKPPFMIPSYVIKIDEIPLNVNGKVDKRALPDVNRDSLRAKYVAPTNDVEKNIVGVFKLIFNQDDIGILDDFVRLGGDSLTAIKVLSYLEEYNFSAADILRLRTPKAISENINKFDFDLNVYSLESGCPLNEPQLNVYLDIVAHDKKDSYIIPHNISVSKKYGLDELVDALNVMTDVHPILTMRVSDEFEVPYLVKGNKPQISIDNDIDEKDIKEFIIKPFDLSDSLCRFLIVENDDAYNLFAVFHHLIFDGLSGSVFKQVSTLK